MYNFSGDSHYTWIASLDRLLNKRNSMQRTFCPRCLYGFCVQKNGKKNRDEHVKYCCESEAVKISYPPEGKF